MNTSKHTERQYEVDHDIAQVFDNGDEMDPIEQLLNNGQESQRKDNLFSDKTMISEVENEQMVEEVLPNKVAFTSKKSVT